MIPVRARWMVSSSTRSGIQVSPATGRSFSFQRTKIAPQGKFVQRSTLSERRKPLPVELKNPPASPARRLFSHVAWFRHGRMLVLSGQVGSP